MIPEGASYLAMLGRRQSWIWLNGHNIKEQVLIGISSSLYIATIINMKSVPLQYVKQTCRCNIELHQTDCIAGSRENYIYKTGQARKRKEVISIVKTATNIRFFNATWQTSHNLWCGNKCKKLVNSHPWQGEIKTNCFSNCTPLMEGSPKSRKEANIFLVTTYVWVQMVGRIKRPKSTLKIQLTIKAAKYQTRNHMNKTIRSVKKHMKREV